MSVRLLLAGTAALGVALSGPFVGEINSALQNAFPGQYTRVVLAAIAAPAVIATGVAIARVRERRLLRFAAIAAAMLIAILYVSLTAPIYTERFHLTEYGVLTFLFYRAWVGRGDVTALLLPLFAAFIAGVADEWVQWFVPSRVGELRDVLLNGTGVAAGLLFAIGLQPPASVRWPADRRSRRVLALGASMLIGSAAVFVQSVHLGFEIADGEIGTFRSRFSAPELRALSAGPAGRWPVARPSPPLLSREDHYLSEATFHIQERNRSLGDGNAAAAWRENLILERFYRPVLDFAMPASRWPPEQRVDVAARAAGDRRVYVSEAYPLPLYAWNRTWFWAATAVLIGIVWLPAAAGGAPRKSMAAPV